MLGFSGYLGFLFPPKTIKHKNPLAKKPELKAFKTGGGLERAKDFQASSNIVKDAVIQSVFGGLHEINLQSQLFVDKMSTSQKPPPHLTLVGRLSREAKDWMGRETELPSS